MIPAHFQLQYSKQEIAQSVQRMGAHITQWAKQVWDSSHTDILAVPVLRGGIFFFADLVRTIDMSAEVAVARSVGYQEAQNAVLAEQVLVHIGEVPAKGRAILVIDDICDSGRTLQNISAALIRAGASEVRTAVLIKRKLEEQTFIPSYVGFDYVGPEWFVGYGMDDSNRFRNLPDIYVIKQTK